MMKTTSSKVPNYLIFYIFVVRETGRSEKMKTVKIVTIGGMIVGIDTSEGVTVITKELHDDYEMAGEDEDQLNCISFSS